MEADVTNHPSLRQQRSAVRRDFIEERTDYRPSPPRKRQRKHHNPFKPDSGGLSTCSEDDEINEEEYDNPAIYIGNIDISGASIADVFELVREYGSVKKMRIHCELPFKIYAFVLFDDADSARKAAECLDGMFYHDRRLNASASVCT